MANNRGRGDRLTTHLYKGSLVSMSNRVLNTENYEQLPGLGTSLRDTALDLRAWSTGFNTQPCRTNKCKHRSPCRQGMGRGRRQVIKQAPNFSFLYINICTIIPQGGRAARDLSVILFQNFQKCFQLAQIIYIAVRVHLKSNFKNCEHWKQLPPISVNYISDF